MKKNSGVEYCHCHSKKGMGATLILIGAAYALQYNGMLFRDVTLWPWVLVALGICIIIFKDEKR